MNWLVSLADNRAGRYLGRLISGQAQADKENDVIEKKMCLFRRKKDAKDKKM